MICSLQNKVYLVGVCADSASECLCLELLFLDELFLALQLFQLPEVLLAEVRAAAPRYLNNAKYMTSQSGKPGQARTHQPGAPWQSPQ